MRRYLAATLLIGFLAAAPVLVLWQWVGWGDGLADAFHDLYQRLGLVPPSAIGAATGLLVWITVPLVALAVAWCVVDIPRPALKLVAAGAIGMVILGLSPTLAFFSSVLQLNQSTGDGIAAPGTVHCWLLEPVAALLAGMLALIGGLLYGRTAQGRRKRLLNDLTGNRLSRASLHRWIDSAVPLPLKGDMLELTVLRCRIFNMVELQEKLSAPELLEASNEFQRAASDFLIARGAYLDECATDGLRAVFGLPVSDHCAADACAAALELRTRMSNLSLEHQSRWNLNPEFGVGIASGEIAVGLIGNTETGRLGFTGSLLEKSRRLCDANESLGGQLLIDSRTHQLAGDQLEVRPLDLWRDAASGRLQECFEILCATGGLDEAAQQRRDRFWQGVIRLREGMHKDALDCFQQARDADRPDPVLDHMIKSAGASKREATSPLS